MNALTQSIRRGVDRTFVYSERTGRAEYWWYTVPVALLGGITGRILFEVEAATGSAVPLLFRISAYIFVTLTLVSATVRRLHDTGRSAYWVVPGAAAGLSIWALMVAGLSDTADDASNTIGVLGLTAAIGGLAALPCWIFMFFRGDPESNRYGPPTTRTSRPEK